MEKMASTSWLIIAYETCKDKLKLLQRTFKHSKRLHIFSDFFKGYKYFYSRKAVSQFFSND